MPWRAAAPHGKARCGVAWSGEPRWGTAGERGHRQVPFPFLAQILSTSHITERRLSAYCRITRRGAAQRRVPGDCAGPARLSFRWRTPRGGGAQCVRSYCRLDQGSYLAWPAYTDTDREIAVAPHLHGGGRGDRAGMGTVDRPVVECSALAGELPLQEHAGDQWHHISFLYRGMRADCQLLVTTVTS
jgi:hypothetical protein